MFDRSARRSDFVPKGPTNATSAVTVRADTPAAKSSLDARGSFWNAATIATGATNASAKMTAYLRGGVRPEAQRFFQKSAIHGVPSARRGKAGGPEDSEHPRPAQRLGDLGRANSVGHRPRIISVPEPVIGAKGRVAKVLKPTGGQKRRPATDLDRARLGFEEFVAAPARSLHDEKRIADPAQRSFQCHVLRRGNHHRAAPPPRNSPSPESPGGKVRSVNGQRAGVHSLHTAPEGADQHNKRLTSS